MAKSPSHGRDMGALYLLFWRRNYPHDRGTRPFKEAIRSGLDEYLQALQRAIEGLTPAEAYWQPTLHTNHIAWLVWHMARAEDRTSTPYRPGRPVAYAEGERYAALTAPGCSPTI